MITADAPVQSVHEIPIGEVAELAFEPNGGPLRVVEATRLALYDTTTLSERRAVSFPTHARPLAGHGDAIVVGHGNEYWICKLSTGGCRTIPDKNADPSRAYDGVEMSPTGRYVVFGRMLEGEESRFRLHIEVYDTTTGNWSPPREGKSHAVAGGVFQLCGTTEERASWCYSRAPGVTQQDLRTGAIVTTIERANPSIWRAAINPFADRGYGEDRVEITGPGPSRWVEIAESSSVLQTITCGSSNRALVVRRQPPQLELRRLPDWIVVRQWTGDVSHAACSDDAKRIAWISRSGGFRYLSVDQD